MADHEDYMRRCIELAEQGGAAVAPNPRVGCLIVHQGKIIGEGYHQRFGGKHAEVHAIESVAEASLLSRATLYVNLEPCPNTGKTPPCCERIVREGIRTVVVGSLDPNPAVRGTGIEWLRSAGINVLTGVCEKACRFLNRRFETYHRLGRPYVLLKWAQTSDGFIARKDYSSKWISSAASRALVHDWRAQESAVLVGKRTALYDDPALTARPEEFDAKASRPETQPLRIVLDRDRSLPAHLRLFDGSARTLVVTQAERTNAPVGGAVLRCDFNERLPASLLAGLREMGVLSVLVEGGTRTLEGFLQDGLWDEIRVFVSPDQFGEGIPAPAISAPPSEVAQIGPDRLSTWWSPFWKDVF